MVVLSAVDGPPRTKYCRNAWSGGPSIAAALGPGDRLWGDHRLCDISHLYT